MPGGVSEDILLIWIGLSTHREKKTGPKNAVRCSESVVMRWIKCAIELKRQRINLETCKRGAELASRLACSGCRRLRTSQAHSPLPPAKFASPQPRRALQPSVVACTHMRPDSPSSTDGSQERSQNREKWSSMAIQGIIIGGKVR